VLLGKGISVCESCPTVPVEKRFDVRDRSGIKRWISRLRFERCEQCLLQLVIEYGESFGRPCSCAEALQNVLYATHRTPKVLISRLDDVRRPESYGGRALDRSVDRGRIIGLPVRAQVGGVDGLGRCVERQFDLDHARRLPEPRTPRLSDRQRRTTWRENGRYGVVLRPRSALRGDASPRYARAFGGQSSASSAGALTVDRSRSREAGTPRVRQGSSAAMSWSASQPS
jgi:hypothetical protein